jgi:hypothetical protein
LQGCWEECQSDAECWDWTRHNIKARQSSLFSPLRLSYFLWKPARRSGFVSLRCIQFTSNVRKKTLCFAHSFYFERNIRAQFFFLLSFGHKVYIYRVPQCMSPRRNWDSPTPSRVCPSPRHQIWEGHPRLRVRGWGSPSSDDWRT